MKRAQRLRTAADFQRVRAYDRRGLAHPLLVLYVAPNALGLSRVGITVSGRVGKAVLRNRVRRRLREALRARLPSLEGGQDMLIVARPASATATWQALNQALDAVLAGARPRRTGTAATVAEP